MAESALLGNHQALHKWKFDIRCVQSVVLSGPMQYLNRIVDVFLSSEESAGLHCYRAGSLIYFSQKTCHKWENWPLKHSSFFIALSEQFVLIHISTNCRWHNPWLPPVIMYTHPTWKFRLAAEWIYYNRNDVFDLLFLYSLGKRFPFFWFDCIGMQGNADI